MLHIYFELRALFDNVCSPIIQTCFSPYVVLSVAAPFESIFQYDMVLQEQLKKYYRYIIWSLSKQNKVWFFMNLKVKWNTGKRKRSTVGKSRFLMQNLAISHVLWFNLSTSLFLIYLDMFLLLEFFQDWYKLM